MNINIRKNNKGITLIALVITIIVLLILAGVSIAMLTGQNGILEKANKAKTLTDEKAVLEELQVEAAGCFDTSTGAFKIDEFGDNLTGITDFNSETGNGKYKGYNFNVDITTGKVIITGTGGSEEETGGTGVGINKKAETTGTVDGKEATYANPKIPKGFKAIDVGDAKWGTADGYKSGLVIEDAVNGSATIGSQFVWIPVQIYANFKRVEGYWNGNLDSMISSCKEAGKDGDTIATDESKAMYESVSANKGFYIARYEAGISGTTDNDSLPTRILTNGTVKPLSKSGLGVWNSIPWGGTTTAQASDGLQGNDNADGAVKVARAMYNDSAKYGATSTLCYGVQWDAAMNFIDSKYITGTCEDGSYVKDSKGKGNYYEDENTNDWKGKVTTTGASTDYSVNNIFDMAGNVYEWTMEAYDTDGRVVRGGFYNLTGSYSPASERGGYDPSNTYDDSGFRPALYVEL